MPGKWEAARRQHAELKRKKMLTEPVRCSVVLSTHNKPKLLARTLDSIARQRVPFNYEVIVVDDGSQGGDTRRVCESYWQVIYHRIDRDDEYRNPGPARNVGYRMARGEVIVAQSDDVIHESLDAIEKLCQVQPGESHFAEVWNAVFSDSGILMQRRECYCGPEKPNGLFFLGSIHRKDLYAVGCNDEQFTRAGYEDNFLADCLRMTGIKFTFRTDVQGLHQHHGRPRLVGCYREMKVVYERRVAECEASGDWTATGGAWVV